MVRRAVPEDAIGIASAKKRSWEFAYRGLMPDAVLDSIDSHKDAEAWRIRIAEQLVWVLDVGTIEGYSSLELGDHGPIVQTLYLTPHHLGFGYALLQPIVEEALKMNSKSLYIGCLTTNCRAMNAYKAWGAQESHLSQCTVGGTELPEQVLIWNDVPALQQRLVPLQLALATAEDVPEITKLLHESYKELADRGLRYLATHQNESVTHERLQQGRGFKILRQNILVGTITLTYPEPQPYGTYSTDLALASFSQFAIRNEFKGQGYGSRILRKIEQIAANMGAEELALDTAQGANHLIAYYQKRGYEAVGTADWSQTNYESTILRKYLC